LVPAPALPLCPEPALLVLPASLVVDPPVVLEPATPPLPAVPPVAFDDDSLLEHAPDAAPARQSNVTTSLFGIIPRPSIEQADGVVEALDAVKQRPP
jgi:hypothetical protein